MRYDDSFDRFGRITNQKVLGKTYSILISVWKHVGNIEIDNYTRQNLVYSILINTE
jgi:hypothetical protein